MYRVDPIAESTKRAFCHRDDEAKMQRIIGLLKSSSISNSSTSRSRPPPTSHLEDEASQPQQSPPSGGRSHMAPCLENLPAEIINIILTHLPPVSLAAVLQTSKHLQAHAENEQLWMRLVKENISEKTPLPSPAPAQSWKALYAAHHPYWFLTRHKIWFSDETHLGRLLIARYDYRRGCIEAYPLFARVGPVYQPWDPWEYDPSVLIHPFSPSISLVRDDPVVHLNLDRSVADLFGNEVKMQVERSPGISSMLSLCIAIPPARQDPRMALWPPETIPSVQKVRNESATHFRHGNHRPKKLAEASDQTFRLRTFLQWPSMLQPRNSIRMGENVSTFSTLLEESYTPTASKPYQGLFVGDYSAHGCEFLLVMQTDHPPEVDISRRSSSASGGLPSGVTVTPREISSTNQPSDAPVEESNTTSVQDEVSSEDFVPQTTSNPSSDRPVVEDGTTTQPYIPSGRIEAIKLTGDENVPRGECTWFADDIGDAGLVRVVEEEQWRGARIVRSMGQVAAQNHKNARFVESQLILISHDTVAQYWVVSCSTPLFPLS